MYAPASHASHASPGEAAAYPGSHTQAVTLSLPFPELVCEGHAVQLPDPVAVLNVPASHALHAAPSEVPLYPAKHLQPSLPDAELVPIGHRRHTPVPIAGLYLPVSHAEHAAPSDVPLYPIKHVQSIKSSLPNGELVPAGHGEHSTAPVATLYVPAPHAVHSATVYPARHTQSVALLLPFAELVCEGHAVQVSDPVTSLYVPALHALHCNPSDARVYPATHKQSVNSLLPSAELVCEGQAVQFPVPTVALYHPASHALHTTPSEVPLYPAKHLQSVNSTLPDAELVPAGHVEHSPVPVVAL